jgi:hypothetical protein
MIGALPPEGRGAPATGNCGGQTAIWTCLKDYTTPAPAFAGGSGVS